MTTITWAAVRGLDRCSIRDLTVRVMGALWTRFIEDMKVAPALALLVLGAYASFLYLVTDHVSKHDIESLHNEVIALKGDMVALHGDEVAIKSQLKYDHTESELHKTQQDLFALSQHMQEEEAKGHVLDRLYIQRKGELVQRERDLTKELDRLPRDP